MLHPADRAMPPPVKEGREEPEFEDLQALKRLIWESQPPILQRTEDPTATASTVSSDPDKFEYTAGGRLVAAPSSTFLSHISGYDPGRDGSNGELYYYDNYNNEFEDEVGLEPYPQDQEAYDNFYYQDYPKQSQYRPDEDGHDYSYGHSHEPEFPFAPQEEYENHDAYAAFVPAPSVVSQQSFYAKKRQELDMQRNSQQEYVDQEDLVSVEGPPPSFVVRQPPMRQPATETSAPPARRRAFPTPSEGKMKSRSTVSAPQTPIKVFDGRLFKAPRPDVQGPVLVRVMPSAIAFVNEESGNTVAFCSYETIERYAIDNDELHLMTHGALPAGGLFSLQSPDAQEIANLIDFHAHSHSET
eukprot:m.47010 g.47010  ORF g.47010 m.47010 type:complete len:357 (+) comp17587_c0_seq2:181-1251(+)